jgi:glutamate formiminotransferase
LRPAKYNAWPAAIKGMNKIVECIPNFSEGRDAAKVEAVAAAISAVPGVVVLDRTMDADHHRSVITFAGEPEAVLEAAFRAAEHAVALIDLNEHAGEHPRLGAIDVLPFVPIKGVTMDDCVAIARRAGERIARELGVPVYFYERAATRPDRVDLADVRRGEFEGLRAEIAANPDRAPDCGGPRVHPTAGAVAVGARPPLIAYNVNLHTEDLGVAKKIAQAVRGRDGGLRYVKALGFALGERRQVQVSMNLVNYEATPLFRAFEMVRREAERYGVRVAGSEIVGLVPQAALNACADFYLQVENFSEDLILEQRLQRAFAEAQGVGGEVAALAPALAGLREVCDKLLASLDQLKGAGLGPEQQAGITSLIARGQEIAEEVEARLSA